MGRLYRVAPLKRTMIRFLSLLLILPAVAAHAATVAVHVRSDGGPIPAEVAESLAWFAVAIDGQHRPRLVDERCPGPACVAWLSAQEIPAFVEVELRWSSQEVGQADGPSLRAPSVAARATAYQVAGRRLVEVGRGESVAVAPVERVGGQFVARPELAAQRALGQAVYTVRGPAWGPPFSGRRLPVVLAADAAWKVRHGAGWREAAMRRIDLASAILAEAGFVLEVVDEQDWPVPLGLSTMSARLNHLAALPRTGPEGALRIGLTGVASVAVDGGIQQVGRAFEPGRDLVISDQRAPGGDPRWDAALEAAALAHEVLHALGVSHEEDAHTLMSGHHEGLAHRISSKGVALATAAVSSRAALWDDEAALRVLADAAERWLVAEPEKQLSFVAGNLGSPPDPGAVAPGRLSPIANAALSRLHLDQAFARPEYAARHTAAAMVHAVAVRRSAPWLVDELRGHILEAEVPVEEPGAAPLPVP